jgi:hypothetical protein
MISEFSIRSIELPVILGHPLLSKMNPIQALYTDSKTSGI